MSNNEQVEIKEGTAAKLLKKDVVTEESFIKNFCIIFMGDLQSKMKFTF